jgi:hypothetical protein
LDSLELHAHLLAKLEVEVRERLVEQEKFGVKYDCQLSGRPLLLAARELGRVLTHHVLEAHQTDCRQHAIIDLRLIHFADVERIGDIFLERHVGPDGVALDHHPDVALLGGQVNVILGRGEVVSPSLISPASGL